jgi:hypothetical protein
MRDQAAFLTLGGGAEGRPLGSIFLVVISVVICEQRKPSPIDRRDKSLLVVIGADVVTVLPTAMRAVWKSDRLRGKNHSYREGDTHKQHFHS